jgi:hemoglobin-like flavoprotein
MIQFFSSLFQTAPEVASYFSSTDISADDFQEHIGLVMGTLDSAITNLDNLAVVVPGLQKLGATHASLGVKKEYFNVSNYYKLSI